MNGRIQNKGNYRKTNQRQAQVNTQENKGDPCQQKEVLENKDNDRGKQFMHVLNIICDPSHQTAHGIARKECNRQALDMGKQCHPQIMHDHLAGIFHDDDLNHIENKPGHDHGKENTRYKSDAGKIILAQYCKIFFPNLRKIVKRYSRQRTLYLETVGIFIDNGLNFRVGDIRLEVSDGVIHRIRAFGHNGFLLRYDIAVDSNFSNVRKRKVQQGYQNN